MLYSTCPTCGYFLGQKILEWETKSKEICDNPKNTREEKEKLKENLLKTLKLRRYCCKMRIMSYKDLVYEISPVIEDL
jgi:DNA-directed RNA polymerase subunit N (RpoN/RPB10)